MSESIPYEIRLGRVTPDGSEVMRRRLMKNWDGSQLGDACGLSARTIDRMEKGDTVLRSNLTMVAKALNVDLVDLVCESQKVFFCNTPIATEPWDAENAADLGIDSEILKLVRNSSSRPTAPPSHKRLYPLPDDIPDLIGRDKLIHDLAERMRKSRATVGLFALRGMGGVGKTTLATRIAREVKDHYTDGVFFLDLEGMSERPLTPVMVMTRFIQFATPGIADLPVTEVELLPIYHASLSGKRVLIVLDNAAGESQIKSLIAGDNTGFIITSRSTLAMDGVTPVQLEELLPTHAYELLRGILMTKGTQGELEEVASLCTYLPLALRVAGNFLRFNPAWTVAAYIKALKKAPLNWLKVGDDPTTNVEAVLKLSSQQLVREDPELATQWHFLAKWPSDYPVEAIAAGWGNAATDEVVLSGLSQLVKRSLLIYNEESRRYRLHDLMKPIARGLFG